MLYTFNLHMIYVDNTLCWKNLRKQNLKNEKRIERMPKKITHRWLKFG